MQFYDQQSESTCLSAGSLSLVPSQAPMIIIISNRWLLIVRNVAKKAKTIDLHIICPKEITKIPC